MHPPPNRITRLLIAGLVMSLCTLFLLAWLSSEVIAGDTAHFDDSVRTYVHERATPALTILLRGFTTIGSPWVLWPMVLLTFYSLWRADLRYEALVLGVSMAGAIVLENGLKLAFHRPRPSPFFGLDEPASYSYPSGHALFSFCFYGTLALLSMPHVHEPARRVAIWIAAIMMIALIGFSRVYLGVHYATDVIAGYAAAFVWLTAVYTVFRLRRGKT
jgi:undecaprenyl-diphosphatase